MKREDQVRAALAILKPGRDMAEGCQQDIEHALNVIAMDARHGAMGAETQSKRGRANVARFCRLLESVQLVYQKLPSHEQFISQDLAKAVDKTLPYIKAAKGLPARAPARASHRQQAAVREARDLLVKWGHEVRSTSKGKWDRLSAILYGKPNISLQRHLVTRRKKRSG